MTNIISFFKGLSSDVIAFAIIFLAVAAYGLYRGKESLVSFLISLYLGMIAYTSAPFLKSLLFFKDNSTQIFFSKAVVYLIVVIAINFAVSKIIGVGFAMSKVRNWIEIAALSVAVAASAIVIAFNALSLQLIYTSSLISTSVLASGVALFWTLIGSLVIVFLATR